MTVVDSKATVRKPAVRTVQAKEIVIPSRLPKAPYVANPYTGCQMGCLYCYAAFIARWTGHTGEQWGTFVDVKVNAPDLLDGKSHGGKQILLSSTTDPYQPLEGRYRLTRRLLIKLAEQYPQPDVEILTKSFIVTRDIDVLKRFRRCVVGFSFSTLDERVRRIVEPVTPTINRRVAAVRMVHAAGIRTYVFVSPILPYITDVDLIVRLFREDADYFMFENLNVRPYIWSLLKSGLERLDPALVPRYEEIYFRGGHARFWGPVEAQIRELVEREGLRAEFFFHHTGS